MIFGYDLIVIGIVIHPNITERIPCLAWGSFFSGRAPRPYKVLFLIAFIFYIRRHQTWKGWRMNIPVTGSSGRIGRYGVRGDLADYASLLSCAWAEVGYRPAYAWSVSQRYPEPTV